MMSRTSDITVLSSLDILSNFVSDSSLPRLSALSNMSTTLTSDSSSSPNVSKINRKRKVNYCEIDESNYSSTEDESNDSDSKDNVDEFRKEEWRALRYSDSDVDKIKKELKPMIIEFAKSVNMEIGQIIRWPVSHIYNKHRVKVTKKANSDDEKNMTETDEKINDFYRGKKYNEFCKTIKKHPYSVINWCYRCRSSMFNIGTSRINRIQSDSNTKIKKCDDGMSICTKTIKKDSKIKTPLNSSQSTEINGTETKTDTNINNSIKFIYCYECGCKLISDAKFCHNCGFNLRSKV